MATKPSSTPEIWASNALYTTGPFIGLSSKVVPPGAIAAEGHRPGAAFPTPAEYENSQQNRITALCQWVFSGNNTGTADAHIVETDATGRATLEALTVNNVGGTAPVLVAGNSATLPAVLATNTADGGGFRADLGTSAGSALSGDLAGSNVGVNFTQAGGSVSVLIAADATATQDCINILQSGAGRGINVQGGGGNTAIEATAGPLQIAGDFIADLTSLHALRAIGGTMRAIYGVGQGSGRGAEFLGGNLAPSAAMATGGGNSAHGFHGRTANGAGPAAYGVLGEGRGAGAVGVVGDSQQGHAFVFRADPTSPAYPLGRFEPQDADPTSSSADGDFTYGIQSQPRICKSGFGYRPIVTMPSTGSSVIGIGVQAFNTQLTYTTSFTPILTVSCLASQGNGFAKVSAGSHVRLKFEGELRLVTAVSANTELRFVDATGGGSVTICSWVGAPSINANSGWALSDTFGVVWQRTIMAEVSYPAGADGDLVIRVELRSTGSNSAVRLGRLEVVGTF